MGKYDDELALLALTARMHVQEPLIQDITSDTLPRKELCVACGGSGMSTRGHKCVPCGGTGEKVES